MGTHHATLIKRAATASLVTAITLLLAKIFAWTISDSTSVLSSLLDSSMDIIASAINFVAVRYALMPLMKTIRLATLKQKVLLPCYNQRLFLVQQPCYCYKWLSDSYIRVPLKAYKKALVLWASRWWRLPYWFCISVMFGRKQTHWPFVPMLPTIMVIS